MKSIDELKREADFALRMALVCMGLFIIFNVLREFFN
jgi:hypothetical protein